ncbi:MAG: indolepyruvate oxidoreductase subunit beta family protein [Alphaproteobacteria bacterium]|nr:indolepyruvate oxidoreductase subunit beta family protein [Alphaproteobacteria bacterium]
MTDRPFTLLILALGGEGGGVLTDWLSAAAEAEGLIAQATSIPGVAQRTGATTYYLEFAKAQAGAPAPILSLYPAIGDVDLVIASELLEAGRAIANGFVTPDRTTLIASTHRIYAIAERMAMGDGRYDRDRLLAATREMAKTPLLFDMAAASEKSGGPLSAVMAGALVASGNFPLSRQALEAAIRAEGKSVEANLRGFEAGLALASPTASAEAAAPAATSLDERINRELPEAAREIASLGAARVADFQNEAYAARYLDRLGAVWSVERDADGDGAVTRETARQLALWMAYEDVIRVAQMKLRPGRIERIRAEARARDGEPVRVVEFLKPGIEEISGVLPFWLGGLLKRFADATGLKDRLQMGLALETTGVVGYFVFHLLAGMRTRRPQGLRFQEEQKAIERWLDAVRTGTRRAPILGAEIVACARLIKGYSDTHARGLSRYERIMGEIVWPALAASGDPQADAARVNAARAAAHKDPEGKTLDAFLAPKAQAAE